MRKPLALCITKEYNHEGVNTPSIKTAFMHHTKMLGTIEVDATVWKKLSKEEKERIEEICDEKLARYYSR